MHGVRASVGTSGSKGQRESQLDFDVRAQSGCATGDREQFKKGADGEWVDGRRMDDVPSMKLGRSLPLVMFAPRQVAAHYCVNCLEKMHLATTI